MNGLLLFITFKTQAKAATLTGILKRQDMTKDLGRDNIPTSYISQRGHVEAQRVSPLSKKSLSLSFSLSLAPFSLSLSRSCSLVELLVVVVAPNSSGEKIHLTSAQEEHEYDIHKQ